MADADLILTGGPVITVDPRHRIVEALATRNDRIVYVGAAAGALALKGPKTRVIDLKGKTATPGLIEAHCHVAGIGAFVKGVNLKWPNVRNVEDVKRKVAEQAAKQPAGTWVFGRGYNHLNLAEQRHPTRWDLDQVAPNHPVVLVRGCGHIWAVNSLALRMAGMADDHPDPPGGKADREAGKINGVLRETARDPISAISKKSDAENRADWAAGVQHLLEMGYTSAHEMGHPVPIDVIERWHNEDNHQVRVFSVVNKVGDSHCLPDAGGPGYFMKGNLAFRWGHYKLFADGSSSGPTAATRQPYAIDPNNHGIEIYPQSVVTESYVRANRLGFPTTAHAVGDRGIEIVLIGQEAAMIDRPRFGLGGGGTGLPGVAPTYGAAPRHRIEHCGMAMPDLRARLRAGGVIPICQAVFLYEYGDNYVHDYGPERGGDMMPVRSLLDCGIPVALSSDAPVATCDPMRGIVTAMTRVSQRGNLIGPHECVSLLEALRCYTIHGAFAEFAEDIKGSLEVGKLADITVLNGPILDLPVKDLAAVRAAMTIIGGKVAFEA